MALPFDQLFANLIQQESGGNPRAVNPNTGAAGLAQVMPATAADPGFGVAPMDWDKRFDAAESTRFGKDYLQAMLKRYGGDQRRALAAYNWGPGNVDKWSGDDADLPAETRNYVSAVLGNSQPLAQPGLLHAFSEQPQQPRPDGLQQAMAGQADPETVSLFGWDTGKTSGDLSQLSEFFGAIEGGAPAAQAPEIEIPRGPGYVKQQDSLSKALEAFNAAKMRRRA